MSDVRVIGAAMTRFGKFPDATIRSLAVEAVTGALRDADVTASDVDIVFFGNAAAGVLTGQEMIRGKPRSTTRDCSASPSSTSRTPVHLVPPPSEWRVWRSRAVTLILRWQSAPRS